MERVIREVVPRAQREVKEEEAGEFAWFTFLDTDYSYVPRHVPSCNHKSCTQGSVSASG